MIFAGTGGSIKHGLVARYHNDSSGSPDFTFGSNFYQLFSIGGGEEIRGVSVIPDGSIYGAGSQITSYKNTVVLKYKSTGTLDNSFNGVGHRTYDFYSNNHDEANDIAFQQDGKIITVGGNDNGSSRATITRWLNNGSLDTAFNGSGYINFTEFLTFKTVLIQNDGKIVAGGCFTSASYTSGVIVRYNPDGSPDTSFGVNGVVTLPLITVSDRINSIVVQSDSRIIAVGNCITPSSELFITRINTDGSLDSSFGDGGTLIHNSGYPDVANKCLLDSSGRILVFGYGNSPAQMLILRINP